MIAINFFLSFQHHLYFFSGLKFSAYSALPIYWYGFPEMPRDSQLASHICEKSSYVRVCCVYGESVHSQVERWHSQILESKHSFSGLSIP